MPLDTAHPRPDDSATRLCGVGQTQSPDSRAPRSESRLPQRWFSSAVISSAGISGAGVSGAGASSAWTAVVRIWEAGTSTTRARRAFATVLLAALPLLTPACSTPPGLDKPKITIEPRMYLLTHEGKARMQSVTGGQIVNNAAMDTSRFGQLDRDESYGGVLAVGDGFSGLEVSFNKFEIDDSKEAVLSTDFGALQQGDTVNSDLGYDEYRLAYVAEVYEHEFELAEEETIDWQVGVGGAVAHRDGDFNVREIGGDMDSQEIDFRDAGSLYAQLRTRATWRNFSAQIDWAWNPDLHFGGDFDGDMHDLEILLRYQLEAQNLSLVAGYRWSDLPFSGQDGGLRYDADFRVEGYLLGVRFGF